jgi:hypothetical protein
MKRAAFGQTTAAFIEAGIHDVLVEEMIKPAEANHQEREHLHHAVPHPVIQPIANLRPPGVEADHGRLVNLVHEILPLEQCEDFRVKLLEGIRLIRALPGQPAIEPPAQTQASEDDNT